MASEVREPKERILSRSDNVIPNYDHIFDSEEVVTKSGKKKKKNRLLRKLVKMNSRTLILSSIVYLLQSSPVWLVPLLTANIINIVTQAVIGGVGVNAATWTELGINAAIMAFFIFCNVPTTVCRNVMVSKMLRRNSAGLKSAVVRKLQSLSITYHKDMQTGKIQSKFLRDTDLVDQLFGVFMNTMICQILSVIMSVIISVYRNGIVALFFLLVIPVNILITMAFRKRVAKGYHDYRVSAEDMSHKLSTMLAMMTVTKSHGLEQTEIDAINSAIKKVTGSGLKVDKTHAIFGASSWVTGQIMSLITLVFCAAMALLGQIQVGDIVLYQSMFSQINGGVSAIINLLHPISAGIDALGSLGEIMNATDVEVSIGKANVKKIDGNVSFDNVSYKYPNTDQLVVKNFNLDVKHGECIAVVGSSGSGKSTLMNLIIGLLVPTEGDFKIDGKSLTQFNLSEYRHHISVVPQNSILFAGTIRENITYGLEKYSEEDLERVVEMANLKEFLKDLPKGLETNIGEHGDKLSGGQKQRITIARALIRNPKILILDEATSALDNISEYQVQQAISKSIRGRTTFIVAHRLSTIRDADRIVVMEQGEMVEMGTYEELMEKKGKFYELKCLSDINQKSAEQALA